MAENKSSERDTLIFNAKLSEQTERFTEMVASMKSVAEMSQELSVEERNLLSVAYKNVVGTRRASWRVISSIEHKQASKASDGNAHLKMIRQYRQNVERELEDICNEVLTLLDKFLIPTANDAESKVFFYKMEGDYNRYLSEFLPVEKRNAAADRSLKSYKTASDLAVPALAPTHPIRLGLALNFSVFYYEIMNQREQACALAKQSFDAAVAELDLLTEDSYKDSTLIMQLLRDNMQLWNNDGETDDLPAVPEE